MKRARIGQLRHRLTIQQKSNGTPDAMGGVTPTWSTFGTVYGAIEGLSGGERIASGDAAVLSSTNTLITCRYIAGVTSAMRVYHAQTGNVYDILAVGNIDERNRTLELTCRQVART